MKVQAEVSLYPLRTMTLTESIDRFVRRLRERGLEVQMGPISSSDSGECRAVFDGLSAAFEDSARRGDVAAIIKGGNACPPWAEGDKQ